jgi:hypothetical protein
MASSMRLKNVNNTINAATPRSPSKMDNAVLILK